MFLSQNIFLLQLFWLFALSAFSLQAQPISLKSPDGKSEVAIRLADQISYAVRYDGKSVVNESTISLTLNENNTLGKAPKLLRQVPRSVNQKVMPVVREKSKEIIDQFNELRLDFRGTNNFLYSLVFRAYNNGVAYRWQIDGTGNVIVSSEEVNFGFNPTDKVLYPQEESLYSHNERTYSKYLVSEVTADKMASLPLLVQTQSGVSVVVTESDLLDYAGMFVKGNGAGFTGLFPMYPKEEKEEGDRDRKVVSTENFIAKTSGKRTFPWRVMALAAQDKDLLTNQLSYLLATETKEDFSWVKAGKIPWDWWNANNIYGVDFVAGVNTATYKYYIDFAAKYGLEYLVLDEGWSRPNDLFAINPDVNMDELANYAKQKNVGLILWVTWTTFDRQMDAAFAQFEKWGVKGIKVDFMQRNDQVMVNYYEKVAREGAKHKMLVDFHGAYKPAGLQRLYPNALTREGVYGLEQSKWDKDKKIDPEHNVTLPFTRMVAGPMDYTPGAMINYQKEDWFPAFNRPASLGTRCHQLAMYVIYESPLQMLADNPSNYEREPDAMAFLAPVPTVWDETIALDAKIGDYLLMARKAANGDWYIGAMTDWTGRDLTVDLSFLGEGNFTAEIWQDGVNANRMAQDYKRSTQSVNKNTKLSIKLANGGGWVARITSKK